MRRLSLKSTDFGVDPTYSTTFGIDPKNEPHCLSGSFFIKMVDQ